MSPIGLSCLIALAHASSNMLTSSRDSEHPGFITDLGGKISSATPLNKILAKEIGHVHYIMLKRYLSISISLSVSSHEWVLTFVKKSFLALIRIIMFFPLRFSNVMCSINGLPNIEPNWHSLCITFLVWC